MSISITIPPSYIRDTRIIMKGKVVIITGATNGIGRETALELAKRGAKVIIACRDLTRGKSTVQFIFRQTKNEYVEAMHLDLADQASIHTFTQEFKKRYSSLDLLINNAGILSLRRKVTKEGFESQFGINHLGHFLLTFLLMDTLFDSPSARVINVSSASHIAGQINLSSVVDPTDFAPVTAYNQSKLANILFTQELAKRLEGSRVTTYSLHPGFIKNGLIEKLPLVFRPAAHLLLDSAKKGAKTLIYLATEEGIEKHSGQYFRKCRPAWTSPLARDEMLAYQLWEASKDFCRLPEA